MADPPWLSRDCPSISTILDRGGRKSIIAAVPALHPGAKLPPLALADETGTRFAQPSGAALYAIFKTTCPICELTWPYLERIRRNAEGGTLAILAVSQDDPRKTRAFGERLGTSIATAYDPEPWKASDALGITNVPTLFWVGATGKIEATIVGFDRAGMEDLARRAASLAGKSYAGLFRKNEQVPAFKPG